VKKSLSILLITAALLIAAIRPASAQWDIWFGKPNNTWGVIPSNALEIPIQKLDGTILADGYTLNDTSGNNRDARLVNSYFLYNATGMNVVSTSPTTEGYTCKDFSASFIIKGGGGMYSSIITRTNGAGFAGFISTILINPSGELYYYTSNGTTSAGTKIKALLTTVIYRCSVKVNSTGGFLSWVINDTAGSALFTNYTPGTAVTNDAFYIMNNIAGNYYYAGRITDLKIYSDTLYSNLTHWYPFAEGSGKTFYDVVGTAHLSCTGNPNWTDRQNYFHYNWRYGFELYGNDTALIRVPYKSNGDKITPTINAYTKYADCPSGKWNNFAETGIKRNPTNDTVLSNRGIDSSNVVYFMRITGNDSLSFCSNWSGLETNWSVYSAKADRRTLFSVPTGARYMRDSSLYIIAGNSGIRNNTRLKYAFNKTASSSVYYDFFLKDAIYSEYNLVIPEYCGIVGQSKTGTIIRGYQPVSVALDSVNNNSTLNWFTGNGRLSNFTITAQNMRYCVHTDGMSKKHTRYLYNMKMIHYGNGEWTAANAHDSIPRDAWGSGTYPGTFTYVEDSYFQGTLRGYAQHGYTTANTDTNRTITILRNCVFATLTGQDYSFRYSPEISSAKDSVCFYNCNFSGKNVLVDIVGVYTVLADHIVIYSTSPAPTLEQAGTYWEGLKFAPTNLEHTLSITSGTTATLIMGTIVNNIGVKNITDNALVTGFKSLGYYLGDCSSANKTLEVVLNGTPQTITFSQDHTAQSNNTIINFINGQLSGVEATRHYYSNSIAVIPLN
jgi:hypothetical protein